MLSSSGPAPNSGASESPSPSWFRFSDAQEAQFLIFVKYGGIAIGSIAAIAAAVILPLIYFDVDVAPSVVERTSWLIISVVICLSASRAIRAAYERGRNDALQSEQPA